MNVTKCLNNHFFDADKYDVCPHCGANAGTGSTGKEKKEKNYKTFFGKKEDKKSDVKVSVVPDKAGAHTFGLFADDVKKEKENSIPIKSSLKEAEKQISQTFVDNQIKAEDVPSLTPVKKNEVKQPEIITSNLTSSMQEEIRQIANEGKTVGYFSVANPSNALAAPVTSEPVVGWLVCVKGAHFGESFGIVSGRNSIGRGNTNQIVMQRDPSISREKHAWITYEPKKREFYIQPGESSGLTYLNDENIMSPQKMSSFDNIELGEGKFILVALCGEHFTWEDYINRSE